MDNRTFTQRSPRRLTINSSGISDIYCITASNDEIGMFMREYVAEQIEDDFTGGHAHNDCCETAEKLAGGGYTCVSDSGVVYQSDSPCPEKSKNKSC